MSWLRSLIRPSLLLVVLIALALTACQGAVGEVPPVNQPPTPLAPELVGVWQESLASGGEYRDDGTGLTFDMTSGYNAVLKLRESGHYHFSFYAAGVTHDCAFVAQFDQSVGVVSVSGSTLTLTPSERRLDVTDCDGDSSRTLANDPLEFAMALVAGHDFNGMRSQTLELTGGPVPFRLDVLHQEPSATPYVPAQPEDFVLGDGSPVAGLTGLWKASAGDPANYFDPEAGTFLLPGEGEFDYQQFALGDDWYELSRTWTSYDVSGVCQKDYVYFERGTPTLSQVYDIYEDGSYRIGHARLEATEAALAVQIRECGDDDGAYFHELVPVTSYYQWDLWAAGADATSDPAMLKLGCLDELNEWQFMVCGGFDSQSRYFAFP